MRPGIGEGVSGNAPGCALNDTLISLANCEKSALSVAKQRVPIKTPESALSNETSCKLV